MANAKKDFSRIPLVQKWKISAKTITIKLSTVFNHT